VIFMDFSTPFLGGITFPIPGGALLTDPQSQLVHPSMNNTLPG